MRKYLVAIIVLGLLPITSAPANAKVCTYKTRQVKNMSDYPYTKYEYKRSRVCK